MVAHRVTALITLVLLTIVSWIFNYKLHASYDWNLTGIYQQYYGNNAVELCHESNTMPEINMTWISVGAYYGLQYFYVKRGSKQCYNRSKTITLATMCDFNIIHEARQIALNYLSGPMSLAVYFDHGRFKLTETRKHVLSRTISSIFNDLSNPYDIYVGLLFINKASLYYQSKHFNKATSMIWKLPYNALRHMAETQVRTEWVFLVDIDFWYYSQTFSNLDKHFFDHIQGIDTDKTVFIVPPFEENNHTNITMDLSAMTKEQLLHYVSTEQVVPFGVKHSFFQNNFVCTGYEQWYNTSSSYVLNHCTSMTYEPWYIMRTDVSRKKEYRWRVEYIGRGHNKVSRMVTLRHYCFDLMVMPDLFIIHSATPHQVKKYAKTTQRDSGGWQRKNAKRFKKDVARYKSNGHSCLPAGHSKQKFKNALKVKKREKKPSRSGWRNPGTLIGTGHKNKPKRKTNIKNSFHFHAPNRKHM
eukprot:237432_1